MEQLWRAFSQAIPLLLILIPFVILIGWLFYNKNVKKGETKKKALYVVIINSFLILSIIGVLLVTLLPRPGGGQSVQLVPFLSIWDTLVNSVHYTGPIRNIGFNILLFIPLGFFLTLKLQSQYKLLRITIIGMLFSIGVELAQYFLAIGRVSNIDDVILNTFGTFVGVLMGYFVKKHFVKPYLE
ncbi:VanZ family protein [Texcoconibacillus texcoconensis]|uniref:Glycopeptide antibiotics resistance protein n=1 Tax=Texcoconibacillus texcoconensis TaxID=1095777 RepID=A0A840QHX3_9BACI|nr:VanZ family protein [Texcoconibacillus texcoconensis]MBB5171934.1 glycopeptide antibiotics resistance protein [Texcoconibacillus texcoconensis]